MLCNFCLPMCYHITHTMKFTDERKTLSKFWCFFILKPKQKLNFACKCSRFYLSFLTKLLVMPSNEYGEFSFRYRANRKFINPSKEKNFNWKLTKTTSWKSFRYWCIGESKKILSEPEVKARKHSLFPRMLKGKK